jgi:hypothetical protein
MRQQKLMAFKILDLPEAFGPKSPRHLRTFTPSTSITLDDKSWDAAVWIFAKKYTGFLWKSSCSVLFP